MFRARGCILLAIPLIVSLMPLGTPAVAKSRMGNYTGQLDYATFHKAAARNETVTIRYSPGGTGASAMALARVRNVVIDGTCNSACAWSFVRNANACFTPRASFGFHAAHDPGTGRRMNAATTYWLQGVRPSLRGHLKPLLDSSSVIRVTATDMRRHYGERSCGASKNMAKAPAPSSQKKERLSAAPSKLVEAAQVAARAMDAHSIAADAVEREGVLAFTPVATPDILAEAWEAVQAQRQITGAPVTTGAIVSSTHAEFAAVCEFEAGTAIRTEYTMLEFPLP